MIKTRIQYLAISFILSIGSVLFLYFLSPAFKKVPNGFIRLLPPHLLLPGDVKDIIYPDCYIAGITKDSIYLANTTDPYHILTLDRHLKKQVVRSVIWSKSVKIRQGATIALDSPYLDLKDGLDANLFRARLNQFNKDATLFKTPPFTASVQSTSHSWVYRCITTKRQNVIVKQSFDKATVTTNEHLLQAQTEGFFSTDGTMVSIPGSGNILYLYFYRNQFFRADSNLKLLYRAKTIDTISHAHVTVAPIRSANVITFSSPPLIVNRNCFASEKYLFVNSALSANNEYSRILDDAAVIDVYNISDGKYKFSFYVPNFRDKKLNGFQVYGKTFVAINDRYISTYKINFN